jgi:hypothetical protein
MASRARKLVVSPRSLEPSCRASGTYVFHGLGRRGSCWWQLGTAVPSVTRPAYSDTCTPVGDGSVEVGYKVFPWQKVFPFSSHTCFAWEALSCGPASPLSLLTQRDCPACDLLPRALVCSCTRHTALHLSAARYPLLPIGATCAYLTARQRAFFQHSADTA